MSAHITPGLAGVHSMPERQAKARPQTGKFMTPDELSELTEGHTRATHIAWLDAHGWTYTVSRMGNPKVLWAYAEQKMGLGSAVPETEEPDFSHWGKAA